MSEQQPWMNQMPPKTMFFGGLVGGVLVLCTLGFFVMLGVWLKGDKTTNAAAAPALNEAAAQPTEPEFQKPAELNADDHVLGASGAEVTLIEYSDLQCPFCQRFQPTAEKLVSDFPGKVKLAFRHFPLESIHPWALKAAEASECVASAKGNEAFWKYINNVFNNQEALSDGLLADEAVKVGLNKAALADCLAKNQFTNKVRAMQSSGDAAGVQGTPATFVVAKDGSFEVIPGALSYDAVKPYVERALNK